MPKQLVRCAVYTRKSSEEGLDQSFNSIDAQQEACRAFIRSQKHEGWIALPDRYDDGGFSGGSMARPSLKRLLDDIQAGQIDIVVVYKVDRLTRSLADFAKMIEIFDSSSISFVSVTQQFNTTSSMGRLTLNVLLSFAQFEREITGERIRDKIAASKKKGMWMGGNVPLGYDCIDRRLVINKKEAENVQKIFRQYLESGSVGKLKELLDHGGVCSKSRTNSDGTTYGGRPFSRGALHHLLRNRIYIGETVHKSCSYRGQHEAIIGNKLWEQVAEGLKQNDKAHRSRGSSSTASLLTGTLFDTNGVRFTPTHAVKNGRRYRYYTSQAVISKAGEKPPNVRVPAHPLEQLVTSRLHELIDKLDQFLPEGFSDLDKEKLMAAAERLARNWKSAEASNYGEFVRALVKKVTLGQSNVWILVSTRALIEKLLDKNLQSDIQIPSIVKDVTLSAEFRTLRRGVVLQLISPRTEQMEKQPLPSFLRMVARARVWYERIVSGEVQSIETLAKEVEMTPRSTRRVLRWAALSPRLIESIVRGNYRPNLTGKRYLREFPLDWQNQNSYFLQTSI
jgi:DNA invertase Pin-like site-specific DNA recombinase